MMYSKTPGYVVRGMQDFIQAQGQPVQYQPSDAPAVDLVARVRYLSAVELANAIEAYPLEVTFDARDFPTREPAKGDSVLIDEGRRGVMLVRQVRISGMLIAYKVAVQG